MSRRVQFINDDQLPAGTDWALVDATGDREAVLFIKRSACTSLCHLSCSVLTEVRAIA